MSEKSPLNKTVSSAAVSRRRMTKEDIERRLNTLYLHIRPKLSTGSVLEGQVPLNIAAMDAASKILAAEIKSGIIRETILTPLDDEVDETVEPSEFDRTRHIS